ncbi:MAG: HD domain-containing protein [Lachnospiraceae bacterium]|nr:HD domain-containing protein [Lachnospiraceae bacterium]
MSDILSIIDEYCVNMERMKELNDMQFPDCGKKEWVSRMIGRSKDLRSLAAENRQLIERIRKFLDSELTDDEYEELYACAQKMYDGDYDDIAVLYPILQKLFDRYHHTEEYEKRLFLYKAIFYERTEILNRGEGESRIDEEMLPHIFELKKQYPFLPGADRRVFWVIYYNYVVMDADSADFDINRTYRRFREAMDFWESEEVQSVDRDNEEFAELISLMKHDWLEAEKGVEQASEEVKKVLSDIAEESFAEYCAKKTDIAEYDDSVYALYLRMQVVNGQITMEKAVRLYLEFYRKKSSLLAAKDELDEEEQHLLSNMPERLLSWAEKLEDSKKRAEIVSFLADHTKKTLFQDFNCFHSQFINHVLSLFCFRMLPYLEGAGEKEDWIFGLIIRRQLPTYLHSVMVAEMAEAFSREVLKSMPGFFDDLPEEQKKDIPAFLKKCALFHDIGKTKIADIINLQGRALSDEEYGSIMRHPDFGAAFLEQSGDLRCYADIARGHHRFYDGSGGYPVDYRPEDSPFRSAVDIIRICDCIDAATDHLGRNYKKTLHYDEICDEIISGAGTSYNPRLAQLLERSDALKEKLRFLCTEGREDIMYAAYRDSLKMR